MQQDRDAELHVCFKRSYDVILKHHHSFVVRSVVSVRRLVLIRGAGVDPVLKLDPGGLDAAAGMDRWRFGQYRIDKTSTRG